MNGRPIDGGDDVSVTREDVVKIAGLANLRFDDAQVDAFTEQFQRILQYIEKLSEVDVEGVEPTSHVSLTPGFEERLLRPDEPRPSLPVEEALGNAPDPGHDHFKVPKVI